MAKRDLQRREGGSDLPAPAPRNLAVSVALADAYRATCNPHPDVGPPRAYPTRVKAEAAQALATLAPWAARVTEQVVVLWLTPIQVAVRNPADEARLPGWIAAVMVAVGHLEVGAFTTETQWLALQTFDFFPSAADIYRIVSGPAVEIRQRCDILRRIAEAPATDQAA